MSELQRLRDRVEELETMLGISEGDMVLYRRTLRLDPDSARVLGFIVARRGRLASKADLFAALYGAKPESDWPESEKIIEVRICAIRKALKQIGVEIETYVGSGYSMSVPSRTKLMGFLHGRSASSRSDMHCATA